MEGPITIEEEFGQKTVPQLKEYCAENNIPFDKTDKKADIIAKIRENIEAKAVQL